MDNQEPLFYAGTEIEELKRRLTEKDRRIAAMQAAAAGTREIRHQQRRTIEKQQARIIELERQVRKLGGSPGERRP